MEAGRELDILIAERFFNLRIRDRFTGNERPLSAQSAIANFHEMAHRFQHIPHYSTDIAAAMLVAERIKEIKGKDYVFSMEWRPLDQKWSVDFVFSDYDEYNQGVAVPTLAHAICLAALKVFNQ